MVRIGIISFAHMHAFSYAQAVKSLPNAQLTGVFDEDSNRGQQAARQFASRFYESVDELLDVVDAVIICTENSKHKQYTLLAAAAGKHILCEKPIATNTSDAQEMIKACEKAGVKLQIAFPCRFNTPVRRVKQMLDEGRIGKVLAIRGTNHGQMPGGWFVERELSGGGAVMDHTVHVVDLVRWFLGKEVLNVYAEVDTKLYDVDIDDCGMLSLEWEDGIFMTQDPSWSRPRTFPTWGDVTLFIVGSKGSIALDAFAQKLVIYDDQANRVSDQVWTDDMDLGLIKDFVEMLTTGREPSITGYDGLQAMAVALAAYESSRRREPVHLNT